MYYRLQDDSEKYRNYILSKESQQYYKDELYLNVFDGRSHKENYKPLTFVMTQPKEKNYPVGDIWFGDIPACSEKAKQVIESICDDYEVEFLPCNLEGVEEQYYVFNILGTEDCVDYDKSKFLKYPSSERIMFFEYIEFKELVKRHFFRIKDLKFCHYFINQETKEKLEKAGLKAIIFDNSLFCKK